MLRSYTVIDIPAGTHRILLRGRGATRLWVNGSILATTRFAVITATGPVPSSSATATAEATGQSGHQIAAVRVGSDMRSIFEHMFEYCQPQPCGEALLGKTVVQI